MTPQYAIRKLLKNYPGEISPGGSLTNRVSIDTEILLRPPEGGAKFPSLGHT
jgi:hypothetical protein